MFAYARRHKNKILAILAAGTAGGAAYYAYTRWLLDTQEESDARIANKVLRCDSAAAAAAAPCGSNGSAPGEHQAGDSRELQEENDEQVMAHFESVQRIATEATVPALVPRLRERLKERTGVELLVESLRVRKHPDTGMELTAVGKVELWNQLKLNSFTQAVASVWALPLLDLLLRVQLSIVGRFLYLEKAAPSATSRAEKQGVGAAAGPSAAAQKVYLEHAGHLAAAGIDLLLAKVRCSLDASLSEVALTKTCTHEDLLRIVSDTQQRFTQSGSPELWRAMLLPQTPKPDPDRNAAADQASLGPLDAAGAPDADEEMVADMLKEAALVVASPQFDRAVKAAAALCSRTFALSLQGAVQRHRQQQHQQQPGGGAPLAKLVPLVREAGASLLVDTVPLSLRISELPAARVLCASVYSSGPPL